MSSTSLWTRRQAAGSSTRERRTVVGADRRRQTVLGQQALEYRAGVLVSSRCNSSAASRNRLKASVTVSRSQRRPSPLRTPEVGALHVVGGNRMSQRLRVGWCSPQPPPRIIHTQPPQEIADAMPDIGKLLLKSEIGHIANNRILSTLAGIAHNPIHRSRPPDWCSSVCLG